MLLTPPFKNTQILVTRPKYQAQPLIEALQSHTQATIIAASTLDISAVEAPPLEFDTLDYVIFTSRNAIIFLQSAPVSSIPTFCVGPATAQALIEAGWPSSPIVPSEKFSSEGLLALPALQDVTGKTIAIICGEDPRLTLLHALEERGARVIQHLVYQRNCPASLPVLPQLDKTQPTIVITTSLAGLTNLRQLIKQEQVQWLQHAQLVVVSPAMVEKAQALGFTQTPWLARNPTPEAILDSLTQSR